MLKNQNLIVVGSGGLQPDTLDSTTCPPEGGLYGERRRVFQQPAKSDAWILRLYVAGQSPKSLRAFANLKEICEAHLKGKYKIEVLDLLQNPQLARGDQILAIPTLVRRRPLPVRKIIGNCSNTERVLIGLNLHPRSW